MRKHTEFRVNLIIAAYVVVMMMLCVMSSPLLNRIAINSTDFSVFVTMGRAMLNGKVMYRDVFDHKGIYLYFLNAFAALLTGKSLFGLFVIECIFMTLCAKIVYAMALKYMNKLSAFIAMQIFMMLTMQRYVISSGNLTEEYALLFQLLSIYLLEKDNNRHSCCMMMLQGILAGITLCIRPNTVMIWGGIALVSGVDMLRKRDFKLLFGNIAAGFAGLVISLMPAVIYALLNASVSDTLFGMFGYNFIYIGNNAGRVSFLRRVMNIVFGSGARLLKISLILSTLIVCIRHRKHNISAYYLAMFAFSIISVSLSGRSYGHYFMCFLPFTIPLAYEVSARLPREKYKYIMAAIMAFTIIYDFRYHDFIDKVLNGNVFPKEEYIRCNESYYSEDEKVLVTGNHAVFYNILGVTPHLKYFYIPSNSYDAYPEPVDSQITSILSGENDVIIIVYKDGEDEIYPEAGKGPEIKHVLDTSYDILYDDKRNNAVMFGRKR